MVVSAQQRRLIAATAELGQCPLHTAVQLRQVYGKLAELSNPVDPDGGQEQDEVEEESDMEASDAEDDDDDLEEDPVSDGMPLGTTFRNVQTQQQQNGVGAGSLLCFFTPSSMQRQCTQNMWAKI